MARQFWPVEDAQGNTVQCWDAVNQCWAPISLCQAAMSSGGDFSAPNPEAIPKVYGKKLVNQTWAQGRKLRLSDSQIQKVVNLIPFRESMLAYLASLAYQGTYVPIDDRNNMFEVLMHYTKFNSQTGHKVSNDMYQTAMGKKSMTERLDWGGIFGGLADMVGGIVDGVSNANVQAFLTNWATAYKNYMTTDLGAIQATYNATASAPGAWGGWGAKGALDMLRQYKRTSWADLKNTITSYAQQHNVEIPQSVKDYWIEQNQLEQRLQNEVDEQNRQPGEFGNYGSPNRPGLGNQIPGQLSDFKSNMVWIVAAVVIVVAVLYFFGSKRR